MRAPAIDTTVLLVDDVAEITELFGATLELQGFSVVVAHRGREALERFEDEAPDVAVLDVVLPDMSGIAVCETIRNRSAIPILMISGRASEVEVIAALEAGADDYIVKPFGGAELVARIRAALRRSDAAEPQRAFLRVGLLTISPGRQQAWLGGEALNLPDKEFAVLEALAGHPDRVVTRASLMRDVWADGSVSNKALDATVRRLRQKLGDAAGSIVTVRGVGFRLEPPT
ncbi:MAG: response regulator transcription factor [Acidimicrobiia bacterium]|nr:response regulator transcription factor [Acidimicrobiia bacterium]